MSRTDDQGRTLCTAHTQAGKKCRAPAVKGALVCTHHGAAQGTNGRAAADRVVLEQLVEPAMLVLKDLLENPETPAAVLHATAKTVLDYTGHKPTVRVEGVPALAQLVAWRDELEDEG